MLVSRYDLVIALDGNNYTRLEVTSILFRENSFYSSKVVLFISNLDTFLHIYGKNEFFE